MRATYGENRRLKELAPDEQKFYDEGAEEVEEEIKKKNPGAY